MYRTAIRNVFFSFCSSTFQLKCTPFANSGSALVCDLWGVNKVVEYCRSLLLYTVL